MTGLAGRYAAKLLDEVGRADVVGRVRAPEEHPAVAWARAGLLGCTGFDHGPGLVAPVGLAACAQGALSAFSAVQGADAFAGLDGAVLLGERVLQTGLRRQGAVSPGGGCRLLEAGDGWIAASLVRPEDWASCPAWLEAPAENWAEVAALVRRRSAAALVERAGWLGLAVALDQPLEAAPAPWVRVERLAPPVSAPRSRFRVVDFSGLWAGPLCTRLLRAAGAEVIKVESLGRPDGARRGDVAFFDRMNAGKASVALDFADTACLRALIRSADLVVESARPRALRQLGIEAAELLTATPGLSWVRIQGDADPDRVGFGDDAGVAAGLSWVMRAAYGARLFCGDAIADPLTGLHAALAALAGWQAGGGVLATLDLRGVTAACIAADWVPDFSARAVAWNRLAAGVRPQALARDGAVARPLGADTARIMAGLAVPC